MAHCSYIGANESADCPVCMDMFGPGPATPHVLFCGHCLCHSCVEQLTLSVKRDFGFRCPECGFLELRPLAKIPKNFVLIRLLEAIGGDTSNVRHSPGASPPPPPPAASPPPIGPVYEPGDMITLPSVTGDQEHHVEATPPLQRQADEPDAEPPASFCQCTFGTCTLIMNVRPQTTMTRYPAPRSFIHNGSSAEPDRCTVAVFGNMPIDLMAQSARGPVISRRVVKPCPSNDPERPGVHLWTRYPCGRYGLCTLWLRTERVSHSARCGGINGYAAVEVLGFNNSAPPAESSFGESINCFGVLPKSNRCLLFDIVTRQLLVWCSLSGHHYVVAEREVFESRQFGFVFISAIHIGNASSAVLISRPSDHSRSADSHGDNSTPLFWICIPNQLVTAWSKGFTGRRWLELSQTISMILDGKRTPSDMGVTAAAWSEQPTTGPVFSLCSPIHQAGSVVWQQSYMINNQLAASSSSSSSAKPDSGLAFDRLTASLSVHQPSGQLVSMSRLSSSSEPTKDTVNVWTRTFKLLKPGQPVTGDDQSVLSFVTHRQDIAQANTEFCVDPAGHIWIVHGGDSTMITVIGAPVDLIGF